jgi:hypothetical protein
MLLLFSPCCLHKRETLQQRVDTLDTSAAIAGLSCRSLPALTASVNRVLPGGIDFTLCQPVATWDSITDSGMSQL